MTIHLEDTGKRYRLEWIFRNLDYRFAGAATIDFTRANI